MRLIEFIYDWLAHEHVDEYGAVSQRWQYIVPALVYVIIFLLTGVEV